MKSGYQAAKLCTLIFSCIFYYQMLQSGGMYERKHMGMEILLLGALIVGLPLIIAGLISYYREKNMKKTSDR